MTQTATKKAFVITANDLFDGEVVFWATPTTWRRRLDNAHPFTDQAEAEAALAQVRADEVVGAYIIDVTQNGDDGRLATTHIREAIRAQGPSNYFHGKQQEDAAAQAGGQA